MSQTGITQISFLGRRKTVKERPAKAGVCTTWGISPAAVAGAGGKLQPAVTRVFSHRGKVGGTGMCRGSLSRGRADSGPRDLSA